MKKVFCFITILAIIKTIFIGFDIDESYAVAQAYRLLVGDRLLSDMWEPHQLSAFGSALFMLPYLLLTGGNTTGIILYLRIIGTAIHLLIGLWFYLTAKKKFTTNTSILIALIHINFLPKWVTLPEFEIMHYWGVCILFLALLSWYENRFAPGYLILSGIAFFMVMMTYPTMIILYPIYVFAIWKMDSRKAKAKWIDLLWFTLPILVIGILFLLYLFSYMSLGELWENILHIMMDESHTESLAIRGQKYVKELGAFALQFLLFLPIALLLSMGVRRFSPSRNRTAYLITTMLFVIGLFEMKHILFSFLGEENQFYLYFRFLVITLLGFALCLRSRNNKVHLLTGILPGLIGVLASAAITNMTFEIALARIYIAVMATCFVIGSLLTVEHREDTLLKNTARGTAILFLLGLFVCKLLLVRVTGCIPVSVKMDMSPVTQGPAAGLLVQTNLAEQYNTNFPLIKEQVHSGDNLLYFGCETIYYMAVDAELATPSTQGTSVFNNMFIDYYELHPEKLPNVIIIDKTFEANLSYSPQNQILLDWIEEKYSDATVIETDYFKIIR